MKKCSHCQLLLDFKYFHKKSTQKDGFHQTCKICRKLEDKIRYDKFRKDEKFLEKERKRGIEKSKKYNKKYPEKYQSKSKNNKVSIKGFEKHHWSYNEIHFKDVILLTKEEHIKSHKYIVYDQTKKLYRDKFTNKLLLTKEEHEKFIRKCILEQV
jgi:hypothetical protein